MNQVIPRKLSGINHSTTRFKTILVIIRLFCFVITLISLYDGLSLNRYPIGFIPILIISILWTLGIFFHKDSISNVVFIITMAGISVGAAVNFPLRLLIIATLFALITWDLDHWYIQNIMAMRIIKPELLLSRHLFWLALSLSIGLILTLMPFYTSAKISLWIAFLASLGIIFGLRKILQYSRGILK